MEFTATRYDGLELSPEFVRLATEDPAKLLACCNGVGTQKGFWGWLTFHITPNTIWGLDVTPCSDIHDVDCTYPDHFKSKSEALKHLDESNDRFRRNLETYIDMHTRNKFLKYLRMQRAVKYYTTLEVAGEDSFLEGKILDDNSSAVPSKLILDTVIK